MRFDINGLLNSTNLHVSKALWPLFESVVNSIQSIDGSENKDCGKITIRAEREVQIQTEMGQTDSLGRFESFTVTDNGAGFNEENYQSFQTAYSTLKVKRGCKGIGRFLWLKAFESVGITSTYSEGGQHFRRTFSFSADQGIYPEDNNSAQTDGNENITEIKLCNFKEIYRKNAPVELDVVAKKIIEHCLPFFLSSNCPRITLCDGISPSIDLNQYFDSNIKESIHQDHFQIKDQDFVIYHLQVPEGADAHQLHLCAHMQEVESHELKNYFPDLRKKIIPMDMPTGFYYVGYVTSPYLDSIVNQTRTGFSFDENDTQISITGTGKKSIISASIEHIKVYLAEYLADIKTRKKQQIDDFVAYDKPTYRYMLNEQPEIYDKIPAGLKPAELELELHKQSQAWESEIFQRGKELEKAAKNLTETDDPSYREMFERYWSGVTELSKTALAEYVTRRRAIITMLEEALKIQENGKFKKESGIHSIICPMQHTSDDISFEEMNLWIVDERLAYHRYLASDKTLKSMPVIESDCTKEPDIAVFDRAFAYSDSEEPLSTVTIVEFKKPDNDNKNPLNQVGEYIDLIRSGRKKKCNGQVFNVTDGTLFRCYVICDLTEKMRTHCRNSSLTVTPDNLGYTGYNQSRHAYYEVISYTKLLADARKRNQILFEKLFEPKLGEVIHIPEQKEK